MTLPNEDADRALLEAIGELAAEVGREPGRDMIANRFRVGSGRAARLKEAWLASRNSAAQQQNEEGSVATAERAPEVAETTSILPPLRGDTPSAPVQRSLPADRSGQGTAQPPAAGEEDQTAVSGAVDSTPPADSTGVEEPDRSGEAEDSGRPVESVEEAAEAEEARIFEEGAPPADPTGVEEPDRSGDRSEGVADVVETGRPVESVRTSAPVRPSLAVVVLWMVGAAGAAAVVVRAVQTPVGARLWGWLSGVVGGEGLAVVGAAGGAGVLAGAVGLTLHVLGRYRAVRDQIADRRRSAWSSRLYLLAALVFMGLSVDTSLRFFREKVGITQWWELALVFSGIELGLLACGAAMYEAARKGVSVPHSARTVAWGLAALAGTTGLLLGGWPGGLVRAAGPALAMVMLHLALGIERRRSQRQESVGPLAQMARELRERLVSRLGLADEDRDALARTRLRKARRAAVLTYRTDAWRRDARLRAALAKADLGRDAEARQAYLRELEILRSIQTVEELRATVKNMAVGEA